MIVTRLKKKKQKKHGSKSTTGTTKNIFQSDQCNLGEIQPTFAWTTLALGASQRGGLNPWHIIDAQEKFVELISELFCTNYHLGSLLKIFTTGCC